MGFVRAMIKQWAEHINSNERGVVINKRWNMEKITHEKYGEKSAGENLPRASNERG